MFILLFKFIHSSPKASMNVNKIKVTLMLTFFKVNFDHFYYIDNVKKSNELNKT